MNDERSARTDGTPEGFAADEVERNKQDWRITNLRVGLVAGVAVLVTAVAVVALWAAVRMVEIVITAR